MATVKHARMKRLFMICLGLLVLGLASLQAQNKSTATPTQPPVDSSEHLEDLQQRLDRMRSRLAFVSTGIKGAHFHRFEGSHEAPELVPAHTTA